MSRFFDDTAELVFEDVRKYDPDQPRDDHGRWTDGGGAGIHARDPATAKRVKAEWIKSSPLKSVSQVYAGAEANKVTLDAAGEEIAAATGTHYKAPGIKKMPRVFEKGLSAGLIHKILQGRSPAGVTDIVRSTFITDTPEMADRVAAELGKRFPATDEGWKQTDVGYVDRTVNVRFKNGQIGEVQLMPQAMSDAKSPDIGGGHDLYVKWRSLPDTDAHKASLGQAQRDLYGAAKAKLGPAWSHVIGRLGASGA